MLSKLEHEILRIRDIILIKHKSGKHIPQEMYFYLRYVFPVVKDKCDESQFVDKTHRLLPSGLNELTYDILCLFYERYKGVTKGFVPIQYNGESSGLVPEVHYLQNFAFVSNVFLSPFGVLVLNKLKDYNESNYLSFFFDFLEMSSKADWAFKAKQSHSFGKLIFYKEWIEQFFEHNYEVDDLLTFPMDIISNEKDKKCISKQVYESLESSLIQFYQEIERIEKLHRKKFEKEFGSHVSLNQKGKVDLFWMRYLSQLMRKHFNRPFHDEVATLINLIFDTVYSGEDVANYTRNKNM